MTDMIADVADFHRKFGQPVLEVPGVPRLERVELREQLITEEYGELMVALGYCEHHSDMGAGWIRLSVAKTDLPKVTDAIADLIYVLIGTAHEFGIPLQPIWDAVHASNMAKENGGTDAKGKIKKPPGWVAPDIAGILKAHGWQP